MPAVGVHHTPTVDPGGWDGPAEVAKADGAAQLRHMHAWQEAGAPPDQKGSWKFPHHAAGTNTPADMAGVRNALSRLPQSDIPSGDVAGVQAHLNAHMDDWKAKQSAGDQAAAGFAQRLQHRVGRTSQRITAEATKAGLGVRDLPSLRLPWFSVSNQAGEDPAEPDVATILIYEEIGGSLGASANSFAEALMEITAPTIHLRINSPGGSLFDALAMHSALLHHDARVVTFVDGVAASAAGVVAMAGDEVVMMPGSQLMIHDASMVQDGNAAEMAKASTFLDRQSQNVADLYARRGGHDAAYWRELMVAETWMYGQEAVDLGLADRVQEVPRAAPPQEQELMRRSHDLAHFGYRYAGRVAAPAPGTNRDGGRRAATAVRERVMARFAADDDGTVSTDRHAAAQARGEGAQRRAHQLAQGGRRVPVLSTSPEFRTQLRVVRAEVPGGDPARVQGFNAKMQRAGTVTKGGRQLVHLAGYASMYNKPYDMWDEFGPYQEFVASRAGRASLAAQPDVAFLVNHKGVTMARTRTGTLELGEDDHGLGDDAFVNADRSDVQILLSAIDDELVDEQSFAFMIMQGLWSDDFETFEIREYDIDRGDVSAVNFGANPFTSVAARSQEIMRTLTELPAHLAKAAFDALARRSDVLDLRELATAGAARTTALADVAQTPLALPANEAREAQPGRRVTYIEALMDLES